MMFWILLQKDYKNIQFQQFWNYHAMTSLTALVLGLFIVHRFHTYGNWQKDSFATSRKKGETVAFHIFFIPINHNPSTYTLSVTRGKSLSMAIFNIVACMQNSCNIFHFVFENSNGTRKIPFLLLEISNTSWFELLPAFIQTHVKSLFTPFNP